MSGPPRRGALVGLALVIVCAILWIFWRSGAGSGDPSDRTTKRGDRGRSIAGAIDHEASAKKKRPLGESSRLAGHVVDLDDAPIPEAQVCLALPDRGTELGWSQRCVTADEGGFFEIEPVAPGRHRLSASARGFIPLPVIHGPTGTYAKVGAGEACDELVLRLRPGGAEVRGLIRDIMGGTVADAKVWSESTMTRSDDEGEFSMWLDTRSHVVIEIWAEGYAHAGINAYRPAGRVLEVLLRPEIILSGRVVAAESGAPLADIPVVASAPRLLSYNGSYTSQPQVRTGEDGRFKFFGLGPGRYKPQVRAGPWHGQADESVLLTLGETPPELELKVYPARRLEGRLVRRESREPCADGSAAVYDTAGTIVDRAHGNPDGSLEVGGLLPGAYDLELRCSATEAPLPPIAVDLSEEELLGALWQADEPRGQAIRGKIVDADGEGVAMASIRGYLMEAADPDEPNARANAWAITEADGSFEVSHLPAGLYSFGSIQAEGMASPVEYPKVTLPADRDVDDLMIELPRGGALEVRVQDSSGAPVASATLKVSRVGGGGNNLKSMPGGLWALDPATPGIYHVKLARPGIGGRAGPNDPSNDDPGEEIEVFAGRTAMLTLVTARRDRTITGIVRTRDGDLVADATVWASGSGTYVDWVGRTRHPETSRTVSDIDGEFRLEGLEDGVYAVYARDGAGVEESVSGIASGSDGVALALAQGGSLAGQVQVRGGDPPARFSISIKPADGSHGRTEEFLRTGGAWRIVELPPGEVMVELQCAEGTASRSATIPEGGELGSINLEVAARGALRGRLVDAESGAPVRGYMATVKSANGRASASRLDPQQRRYSGEDGTFELSQVPSGEVVLHLWPTDARHHGYVDHEERVVVRSGGVTNAGTIQVHKRGSTPNAESTGDAIETGSTSAE